MRGQGRDAGGSNAGGSLNEESPRDSQQARARRSRSRSQRVRTAHSAHCDPLNSSVRSGPSDIANSSYGSGRWVARNALRSAAVSGCRSRSYVHSERNAARSVAENSTARAGCAPGRRRPSSRFAAPRWLRASPPVPVGAAALQAGLVINSQHAAHVARAPPPASPDRRKRVLELIVERAAHGVLALTPRGAELGGFDQRGFGKHVAADQARRLAGMNDRREHLLGGGEHGERRQGRDDEERYDRPRRARRREALAQSASTITSITGTKAKPVRRTVAAAPPVMATRPSGATSADA